MVGCSSPDRAEETNDISTAAYSARLSKVWNVVLDNDLSDWERSETNRALDAWQKAAPCDVSFVVSTGAVDDKLPPVGVITVKIGVPPVKDAVGWTGWDDGGHDYPAQKLTGARIVMVPGSDDLRDFQRVVRHELGHAMGLAHTHGVPSIMADPPVPDNNIYLVDSDNYGAMWCD